MSASEKSHGATLMTAAGRSATVCRTVANRLSLDLGSLGNLKSIVNLNSEVSNGTLEFGMPEQQLHYPKVLGPPVNQGGLRTPHRVRPVRRVIKPNLPNPAMNDPAVLAGG